VAKAEFASKLACLSRGDGDVTQIETLIEAIPKYQPGADLAVLERAYKFSEASHQGQQRRVRRTYLSIARGRPPLVDFKMTSPR